MNNKATIFLDYKSLLFSIAYNMLGQVAAAEDIVQDTFVKWLETNDSAIHNTKAYLVKAVTNTCINYLQSARVRRESYIGIWLPEPLNDYETGSAQKRVESYHALSIGILVLLEKLTPQERAIFLLREIFAYDYAELAEIFEKTADNCRQILKRAKANLGKETRRFEVDLKVHEKILHHFLEAVSAGQVEELIQVLKEDIVLMGDGNGNTFMLNGQRITATQKPICGSANVSRLLINVWPKFHEHIPDFRQQIIMANGLPSILNFSGNTPIALVSIEPDGDRISNIYIQTNPDKLMQFRSETI
ncbi:sigma-70 family RNA polymerase sigma factor [Deminuibacter soli]|uniref:RNA polymerase sigma-70 factor n=1 Tax=Deminuibacter soli TaxID=2291815 RepID=A0A3E1NGB7_9BACT|nr:sigma-70 family RNA polymerase sigma factor [Deminuibacter soli]RFM26922.1 RNA polymerase sigma-70 factor [Deminuibacter soli]